MAKLNLCGIDLAYMIVTVFSGQAAVDAFFTFVMAVYSKWQHLQTAPFDTTFFTTNQFNGNNRTHTDNLSPAEKVATGAHVVLNAESQFPQQQCAPSRQHRFSNVHPPAPRCPVPLSPHPLTCRSLSPRHPHLPSPTPQA